MPAYFGMLRGGVSVLLLWMALLTGCSSTSQTASRQIGEAFAGPATLTLHQEINPKSPAAATVSHGERLAIVQRRRRFVRVRTAKGAEGWTDMRHLLSAGQMAELDKLASLTQKLPSQGAATVYDTLNAHTEPNRQAPSLYRVKEGEVLEVIGHELRPRVPFEGDDLIPPPPKKEKKPARKSSKKETLPPLPLPPAPKPPENWIELSRLGRAEPVPPAPEPEPAKPAPVDDWTLVRLPNGKAGWVITGGLRMNIPDEVAQYSEGHRITSYFSMGEVNDGGQKKHNWLWTTLSSTRQQHQFDSFRYFIWNARRHRYETAYIENGIKGYYPVEVGPVKAAFGKTADTFPGFSLIVEDKDGTRYRKTYAFQIYRVVLVDKQRIEPRQNGVDKPAPAPQPLPPAAAQQQRPGIYSRVKSSIGRLFK